MLAAFSPSASALQSLQMTPPAGTVLTPKLTNVPQPLYLTGGLPTGSQVFNTGNFSQVRVVFVSTGSGTFAPVPGVQVIVRFVPIPYGSTSFKDGNLADYQWLAQYSNDVYATFTAVSGECEIGPWLSLATNAQGGDDIFLIEIVDPSNSGKQVELVNALLQFQ